MILSTYSVFLSHIGRYYLYYLFSVRNFTKVKTIICTRNARTRHSASNLIQSCSRIEYCRGGFRQSSVLLRSLAVPLCIHRTSPSRFFVCSRKTIALARTPRTVLPFMEIKYALTIKTRSHFWDIRNCFFPMQKKFRIKKNLSLWQAYTKGFPRLLFFIKMYL